MAGYRKWPALKRTSFGLDTTLNQTNDDPWRMHLMQDSMQLVVVIPTIDNFSCNLEQLSNVTNAS